MKTQTCNCGDCNNVIPELPGFPYCRECDGFGPLPIQTMEQWIAVDARADGLTEYSGN